MSTVSNSTNEVVRYNTACSYRVYVQSIVLIMEIAKACVTITTKFMIYGVKYCYKIQEHIYTICFCHLYGEQSPILGKFNSVPFKIFHGISLTVLHNILSQFFSMFFH